MRLLVNLPKCGKVRMFGMTMIPARPRIFETRVRRIARELRGYSINWSIPGGGLKVRAVPGIVLCEAWIPEYYREEIIRLDCGTGDGYFHVYADIDRNYKTLRPFLDSGETEMTISEH